MPVDSWKGPRNRKVNPILTISSYAVTYLERKTTVTRYNNHITFTEKAQMHKVIMRSAQMHAWFSVMYGIIIQESLIPSKHDHVFHSILCFFYLNK